MPRAARGSWRVVPALHCSGEPKKNAREPCILTEPFKTLAGVGRRARPAAASSLRRWRRVIAGEGPEKAPPATSPPRRPSPPPAHGRLQPSPLRQAKPASPPGSGRKHERPQQRDLCRHSRAGARRQARCCKHTGQSCQTACETLSAPPAAGGQGRGVQGRGAHPWLQGTEARSPKGLWPAGVRPAAAWRGGA